MDHTINRTNLTCHYNDTFHTNCHICVPSEPWLIHLTAFRVWFAINVLLWLLGAVMNLLLGLTIFTDRNVTRVCGLLVGHLVLIDTLMTCIHMPVNLFMNWTGGTHRDDHRGCGVVHFTFQWTTVTGHWTALFLAASRCIASLSPVMFRKFSSPRFNVICIVSAWSIGFFDNLPMIFGVGVQLGRRAPPWYACGPVVVNVPEYNTIVGVGHYSPVILTAGVYVTLLSRTRASLVKRRGSTQVAPQGVVNSIIQRRASSQQRRRLSVKMLAVASCVGWIGYFANPVLTSAMPCVLLRYPMIKLWANTMFFSGYVVNPVRRGKFP